MKAITLLRIQAHANRLANHRLQTSMQRLSVADLHAARTSFFPTLIATLNHIVAVDRYYIGALFGEEGLREAWHTYLPANTLPEWAERQCASDERLISWLDQADDAALDRPVAMPRAAGMMQTDAAAHVLQHLFQHQTHHRGQIHAMLSGTAIEPPQLDEFLMPSEPHLRTAEMAALGWSEARVYGNRLP